MVPHQRNEANNDLENEDEDDNDTNNIEDDDDDDDDILDNELGSESDISFEGIEGDFSERELVDVVNHVQIHTEINRENNREDENLESLDFDDDQHLMQVER